VEYEAVPDRDHFSLDIALKSRAGNISHIRRLTAAG
jgi:hypothetical protein